MIFCAAPAQTFFASQTCHDHKKKTSMPLSMSMGLHSCGLRPQRSFANIYAPNKVNELCVYYEEIQKEIDQLPDIDMDCRVIIGGDFNVILDPKLDGSGGNPKLKVRALKSKTSVLTLRFNSYLTNSKSRS